MQVKCKTNFWPVVYKNVFEFFRFMDILFVFVCQIFSTCCTINGDAGGGGGQGAHAQNIKHAII